MIKLNEEQEALLRQIVDAFRHGIGGEEGPTWEEHVRERELRALKLLASKHGYYLLKIDEDMTWKDDDA